ncbi:hypothetical protein [Oryzicola mucosus]|uniref:Uncharacterized protein n=1 Tax=Oryzicola mucosus TaxID=2767425 RepID=A0A8J6U2Q7_9HYPH|nr:hypothetical protein [Oryzicola mucosus]MBD0415873.1 hypothetical protein [Oryzicola mucosus]
MKQVEAKLIELAPSFLFVSAILVMIVNVITALTASFRSFGIGNSFELDDTLIMLSNLLGGALFQPAILIALAAAVVHLGRLADRSGSEN